MSTGKLAIRTDEERLEGLRLLALDSGVEWTDESEDLLRAKLRTLGCHYRFTSLEHVLWELEQDLVGVKSCTAEEGKFTIAVRLRHHWYRFPWRWQNRRRIRETIHPMLPAGVAMVFR